MQYTKRVKDFLALMKASPAITKAVWEALDAVGREYWGDQYVGDPDIDEDIVADVADYAKALTRADMIKEMEEMGMDPYIMPESLDFTAMDDAYRHVALLDISDPYHPTGVNPCTSPYFGDLGFCGDPTMFSDHVFSWKAVQSFAATAPPHLIMVVRDGDSAVWFPLPSPEGGKRRTRRKTGRRTRKARKARKTRVKN